MSAPERIRAHLKDNGPTHGSELIRIAGGGNPSSTVSRMFQRGELERDRAEEGGYIYRLSKRHVAVSVTTTRSPKQTPMLIEPRASVLQEIHGQRFETVEEWMARTGEKPEVLPSFDCFESGDDDE